MYNVLIVDDHEEVRAVVRATLEEGPYEFFEAANGADGIDQARIVRPDLVVLDITMPGGIDGYDVCSAIKKHPATRAARVLMLTARGQQVDLHRGRLAGCDAYLIKPFSPDHLARTASLLVEPRQLPRVF